MIENKGWKICMYIYMYVYIVYIYTYANSSRKVTARYPIVGTEIASAREFFC